ncbi:hypothetical protein M8J75_014490 [Diaphorina citri]|jgi:hypothetical protein|nr:hypothetical protein M8J75_014490 [Diaphorina citri]KAI5743300.1 hypothetical protein M8J77_016632 [Diaphorina citri]
MPAFCTTEQAPKYPQATAYKRKILDKNIPEKLRNRKDKQKKLKVDPGNEMCERMPDPKQYAAANKEETTIGSFEPQRHKGSCYNPLLWQKYLKSMCHK